ncbi:hypothetical protein OFD51_31625, partial [Escherichia coli]|nr:hypothetical protein [Escherichia coli]
MDIQHFVDFLNSGLGQMLIALVFSLHLIGKSADFIAQWAAKVPLIGNQLATLVRQLGGQFE